MLQSLTIKVGGTESTETLTVPVGTMLVLIGPNNSGKTLLLRDLDAKIGFADPRAVYLRSVEFRGLSPAIAERVVDGSVSQRVPRVTAAGPPPGEGYFQLARAKRLEDGPEWAQNVSMTELTEGVPHEIHRGRDKPAKALFLAIPAANRQLLLEPNGGVQAIFNALLYDRERRQGLSEAIFAAIGRHLVLDAAPGQPSRTRFSKEPMPEEYEDTWKPQARKFLENLPQLSSFSEGIKCYVGVLAALTFGHFKIFTVDEPEAFLHPPLERKLGKVMAEICAAEEAAAVVATHSADFLMGAVQSGKAVTVLRLGYQDGTSEAHVLTAPELSELMREPLLRSAGVLNALFYRAAVVVEGDVDRALYEEINLRLLAAGRGLDDTCFINANGKHTVPRIVAMLRRLGVRAAGVVDLDAIKGHEFRLLARAANIPAEVADSLNHLRVKVKESYGETDPKMVGVAGCPIRAAAEDLVERLAAYGLFFVPVGQLESWLQGLNVTGARTAWLKNAFEKLGSDPATAGYVRPGADDVWQFVERIGNWVRDDHRRGR